MAKKKKDVNKPKADKEHRISKILGDSSTALNPLSPQDSIDFYRLKTVNSAQPLSEFDKALAKALEYNPKKAKKKK